MMQIFQWLATQKKYSKRRALLVKIEPQMIYHLLENNWNVVRHISFNSQAGIFSIIMTNAAKGVSVAISPQMSHSLYNFLKFVQLKSFLLFSVNVSL